jgi:hypothetical protein
MFVQLFRMVCQKHNAVVLHCLKYIGKINPLSAQTLQRARNLNVPCRPKRSKVFVLSCS